MRKLLAGASLFARGMQGAIHHMIATTSVENRAVCNSAAWRIGSTQCSGTAALALLAGLFFAGCARTGPQRAGPAPARGGARPAGPAVGAPPLPADPLLAFAATAAPGTETTVISAQTGRPTRVRMLRAYDAASGRPCREVLVGSGLDERARLLCLNEGSWVEARPLLRGGGTARP